MRHRLICLAILCLSLLWATAAPTAQTPSALADRHQKVFTDMGSSADVVMDIYKGQRRMRQPASLPESASCYLVDGLKYCVNLREIEANYKELAIESKLAIRDGTLYYAGARVSLPSGVQMRLIWQAVLWRGWVICLGRTSNTDKPANMTPPFFATELITFDASKRIAKVKYLSFQPPAGTRIYILSPMK